MIKRFQKKGLHDDRLVSSLRTFGCHDVYSLTSSIPNAPYMANLRAWSILTQDGDAFLDMFSHVKNPRDIIGKNFKVRVRTHGRDSFDMEVETFDNEDIGMVSSSRPCSMNPNTGDIDMMAYFDKTHFICTVGVNGKIVEGTALHSGKYIYPTCENDGLHTMQPYELMEMASVAGAVARKFADRNDVITVSNSSDKYDPYVKYDHKKFFVDTQEFIYEATLGSLIEVRESMSDARFDYEKYRDHLVEFAEGVRSSIYDESKDSTKYADEPQSYLKCLQDVYDSGRATTYADNPRLSVDAIVLACAGIACREDSVEYGNVAKLLKRTDAFDRIGVFKDNPFVVSDRADFVDNYMHVYCSRNIENVYDIERY